MDTVQTVVVELFQREFNNQSSVSASIAQTNGAPPAGASAKLDGRQTCDRSSVTKRQKKLVLIGNVIGLVRGSGTATTGTGRSFRGIRRAAVERQEGERASGKKRSCGLSQKLRFCAVGTVTSAVIVVVFVHCFKLNS